MHRSRAYFDSEPTMEDFQKFEAGRRILARSLLCDHTGETVDESLVEHFVEDCIAKMPKAGWQLTAVEIQQWLDDRQVGAAYFANKWR